VVAGWLLETCPRATVTRLENRITSQFPTDGIGRDGRMEFGWEQRGWKAKEEEC
jgi:hypothetical protein